VRETRNFALASISPLKTRPGLMRPETIRTPMSRAIVPWSRKARLRWVATGAGGCPVESAFLAGISGVLLR
jgi:hypothetical protein